MFSSLPSCHDLPSPSTPTHAPCSHSPPQRDFSRAGCPTHLERLQSPHITRSSQIVTGGEQWPSISSQVIHRFIASLSGQSGMVSVQCCSWASSSSQYPSYFFLSQLFLEWFFWGKNVGSLCLWPRLRITFWAHSTCQASHSTYYMICLISYLQPMRTIMMANL